MLEAYSHNYLKRFIEKDCYVWPHNLTLSRLIARSLRRKDHSLINLKIKHYNDCWLGILIPICLHPRDTILLVTDKQRHRIINFELPRLHLEGLNLAIWEGNRPPIGEQVWLLNYKDFFNSYRKGYLGSRQIVIPEAELFSLRMRDAMALKVNSHDWNILTRAYPSKAVSLTQLYDHWTRKFFSQVTSLNGNVRISAQDISSFRTELDFIDQIPLKWTQVLDAVNEGWASWVEVRHKTLDWCWHLQPLEPIIILKNIFQESPFIMLLGSSPNDLLIEQFHSFVGSFSVNVNVGSLIDVDQEPIDLFVPLRQPLPNTEYFAEYLLDQCRRLILGRSGLTILLIDDEQLLKKLTTELAAEFGVRVSFKSLFPESNGVICCSSFWWYEHQEKLPVPEQIIIAILPFSSLESPLISARVEAYKLKGYDWFRDLLLPEVLTLLPKLVLPLRKSQGRMAILDGRLRSRNWGKKIFTVLEPWNPLDRLLPH